MKYTGTIRSAQQENVAHSENGCDGRDNDSKGMRFIVFNLIMFAPVASSITTSFLSFVFHFIFLYLLHCLPCFASFLVFGERTPQNAGKRPKRK